MTIIDNQFYIIDSLSLDVLLEWNANLVVAWLQDLIIKVLYPFSKLLIGVWTDCSDVGLHCFSISHKKGT